MEIELLTNEQVAQKLGVEVGTLWGWVRRGIFVPPDIERPRYSRYTGEQFARGIAKLQGKPLPEPPRPRARVDRPAPVDTLPGIDVSGAAAPPRPAGAAPGRAGRTRHKWSQADKAAAVAAYDREVITGQKTAAGLADELGVPRGSLTAWAAKSRAGKL